MEANLYIWLLNIQFVIFHRNQNWHFSTDSSRGNASQSRIDIDDSEGDTSFGHTASSFRDGNEDISVTHMVQENSMESQSLDVSEQNSLQMTSTQQQQSEQQSLSSQLLSQNANLSQHAPTSFSRDMFPQQAVGQANASDSVSSWFGDLGFAIW